MTVISVEEVFTKGSTIVTDWIKDVWESDFTEVDYTHGDISLDFDNPEVSGLLQNLRSEVTALISKNENESPWNFMTERDISPKALVAYLACQIVTGNKKSADAEKKITGIIAAQVYTKVLLVPGSGAFGTFHPEVFEKSVDYLKQLLNIGTTGSCKRKKSNSSELSSQSLKNSQSRGRKIKRGRSKQQDETDIIASEDDPRELDDDMNDECDPEEMTPQQIKTLRNHLHTLFVDVVTLLEKFSLRHSVMSACHTVDILTGLTRLDSEQFDGNFDSRVPFRLRCIPALAYKGLSFLTTPMHGQVGKIMTTICKGLLPNLLFLIGDDSVQTITKQLQLIQDHSVNFIRYIEHTLMLCFNHLFPMVEGLSVLELRNYLLKECGERVSTSVRTLIQHMCTKVTDRAEYRSKVAQAVVTLAQQFSDENYCKMVQWFHKLSKHSQVNYRMFAIEIVSTLLSSTERQVTGAMEAELLQYRSHRSLLGILIDKCSDRAPTVRGRAIACFGLCLSSKDRVIIETVQEIMTPAVPGRPGHAPRLIKTPGAQNMFDTVVVEYSTPDNEVTIPQEGSTIATEKTSEGADKPKQIPLQRVVLTPGFDPNLSDREGLFSMLRRRAQDDKLNVRKAAIQTLESAIRFEAPNITKQNLEVLKDHCRDPGLSVRKQALQSLTSILQDMPQDKMLQQNWLTGVLPLVYDRESTLSEKCFDTLEEVILSNLVPKVRSTSDDHKLAWSLLAIVAEPESVDQRRYLQKACYHWSRQGKITSGLTSALETHIGTDNSEAAWMLLAEIAPAAPKIDHSFLMNFWREQDDREVKVEIMGQALTVTQSVRKHLPSTDREWLIEYLKSRLLAFSSPTEVISAMVTTLSKLYEIQNMDTGNKSTKLGWCEELLNASDKYLSKIVLQEASTALDEELIIRHVFTLGEVAQLCPSLLSKRVFLLVESMIATPRIASLPASQPQPLSQKDNRSTEMSDDTVSRSDAGEKNSSHEPGSSQDLHQPSQESLPSQTSPSSQPLTQFRGSIMSERVRAFAFIALGKLCLQHEDLAKKLVAAFARELEVSEDPAIRNNVMIVMCDLCVRYTTVANNYITNISSVLRDLSPLLRKQTLTLITRLLLEDYLKWKGALFYRFISTILDDCEDIRKFSEYCLLHLLLRRNTSLLLQHFIECIFHFNDYQNHTVYNKFYQTDKDRRSFSLEGEQNKKKREDLYKFLLEHMTDEHKFQIQRKICQEILGAIVDGIMPFDESSQDLLRDALSILSSKAIKLTSLKVQPLDDVTPGDEQEMAARIAATAVKKTIITQVLKKNVMENIVPIVISLKHMMEKERSPLLEDLMVYLRELMKDYKNEVKEILLADKQLATEIEYDLKKFDEQQQARQTNSEDQLQVATPENLTSPGHQQQQQPRNQGSTPRSQSPFCPRTPALRKAVRTAAPIMQLVPPSAGTPDRMERLSTMAVLNSARKTLEKGQKQVIGSPMVIVHRENCVDDDTDKESAEARTPKTVSRATRRINRAISTPSVDMGNITFHGVGNMTVLLPSPISERQSVEKVYDESSEDKENEQSILAVPIDPLIDKQAVGNSGKNNKSKRKKRN